MTATTETTMLRRIRQRLEVVLFFPSGAPRTDPGLIEEVLACAEPCPDHPSIARADCACAYDEEGEA